MSISTSTAKIEKLKVDRQSLHPYIQKAKKSLLSPLDWLSVQTKVKRSAQREKWALSLLELTSETANCNNGKHLIPSLFYAWSKTED